MPKWGRGSRALAEQLRAMRSVFFALLAVVLAASAVEAADRAHFGVEGESRERLFATAIGALMPGQPAKVALKWTGQGPEQVTVWYDGDGDGVYGDHEIVVPHTVVGDMKIEEIDIPDWAQPAQAIRVEGHASGAVAVTSASSTEACAFASGFHAIGLDNVVYATAVFNDGTGDALYVGGAFTAAGAVPANHIARWNGTSWSALGAGVGSSFQRVLALAVHDDGSGAALFAGGDFTTAGSVSASRVAKWNGTTWSAVGSPTNGVNGTVTALASFDDGTGSALYVGGSFTLAGGLSANRIARWKSGNWSALGVLSHDVVHEVK
jgi:hypothetical protein